MAAKRKSPRRSTTKIKPVYEPTPDITDVRNAFFGVLQHPQGLAVGRARALEILSRYGVDRIADLKPGQYATLVNECNQVEDGYKDALDDVKGDPLASGIVQPPVDIAARQAAAEQGPNAKATNPKDAVGILKVPFSTVPSAVTAEVGVAMYEGARKYGRHNYRAVGVRYSVYYDAVMRHMTSWWEGEDVDPDSDASHIVKAIACLYVLRDSMLQKNATDDRPPKTPTGWQQPLNDLVKGLAAKYPNAVPAYIEGDQYGVNKKS
jgi:hypothetical protein